MQVPFFSSRPQIFAHRGGCDLGPENTITAFDIGMSTGADGLELETAFVVREGTTLRANYAYLKPKYDVFVDAVCTGPNGTTCADENVANNRAFVPVTRSARPRPLSPVR